MVEMRVRYVNGLQFIGSASSGHVIVIDGGPEMGANDAGIRPPELLLLALGSCSAMGMISILKKEKQCITGCEVRVKSEQEKEWPKRFKKIEMEFIVKGRNLSLGAVKRALELSMEKYSTVKATLEMPAKINFGLTILKTDEP